MGLAIESKNESWKLKKIYKGLRKRLCTYNKCAFVSEFLVCQHLRFEFYNLQSVNIELYTVQIKQINNLECLSNVSGQHSYRLFDDIRLFAADHMLFI